MWLLLSGDIWFKGLEQKLFIYIFVHNVTFIKRIFISLKGLERKLSAADKAPSGYLPFSTNHPEEEVHESRMNKVKVSTCVQDEQSQGKYTCSGCIKSK